MEQAKSSKSVQILNKALALKKERTPSYSGRTLARDLGLSPVFVSKLLRGKKEIPLARLKEISQVLGMDASLAEAFMQTAIVDSLPTNDVKKVALQTSFLPSTFSSFKRLSKKKFSLLSEWYNLALLNILECDGEQPAKMIASRLSLTIEQVEKSLDGLKQAELIEERNGRWRKKDQFEFFPTSAPQVETRNFHRQMIRKAYEELNNDSREDFERRLITGFTIAANPEHLEQAKKEIFEVLGRLTENMSKGPCSDVYQINVQLFPLTKTVSKKVKMP